MMNLIVTPSAKVPTSPAKYCPELFDSMFLNKNVTSVPVQKYIGIIIIIGIGMSF